MVTIYAFTCLENGKAYVGCTAGNIAKRFREHKCNLNTGKHTEPLLLADWRLYGAQRFVMLAVIQLEDDADTHAKRAMEKFVMARYKAHGLLYNLNEACFQPVRGAPAKAAVQRALNGYVQTAETRLKRRLAISATKQAKKVMR